ncbi:MAG: acyl carrier protein [Oscillospiraceae bacterium]|nr:acyl carrier protein [Oscillospiraceae bacterium]
MYDEILTLLKDIQPLHNFEEGVDFTEEGYLDSLDVVILIERLEEKYDIAISPLDFLPENFASIEAIFALVKKSEQSIV